MELFPSGHIVLAKNSVGRGVERSSTIQGMLQKMLFRLLESLHRLAYNHGFGTFLVDDCRCWLTSDLSSYRRS